MRNSVPNQLTENFLSLIKGKINASNGNNNKNKNLQRTSGSVGEILNNFRLILGIRPGCLLSPLLCSIVLEVLSIQVERKIKKNVGIKEVRLSFVSNGINSYVETLRNKNFF